MSFKAKIDNCKSGNLCFSRYESLDNDDDVKSLAEALKGSSVTTLNLDHQRMGDRLKYLTEILGDTQIASLGLAHSYIKEEDLKFLSEVLPNTHITELNLSFNAFGCNGLKYLTQVLSCTKISHLNLCKTKIADESIKYLANVLTCTKITQLDLSLNVFSCNGFKYLTEVLSQTKITHLTLYGSGIKDENIKYLADVLTCTEITHLNLRKNQITDEDIKYLADVLSCTKITHLYLCNNDLRCNGLKHLTQVLSHTKITHLYVCGNKISDESIKYLTDILTCTGIKHLDLRKNIIGIDTAQYLTEKLIDTEVQCLFNVWLFDLPAMFMSVDRRDIRIELFSKIGIRGAQYLNNFRNIGLTELSFFNTALPVEDIKYLSDAFENTQIVKLFLNNDLNHLQHLAQVLKRSQVAELTIWHVSIAEQVKLLAEFLREVKVFVLNLHNNVLGDDSMQYLASALRNSDIIELNLSSAKIGDLGVKYLADILSDSKIMSLNLKNNKIGTDGIKFLVDGLPRSQVTKIHLDGNKIQNGGYQYLNGKVDDTNLIFVSLNQQNLAERLENETQFAGTIPRSTVPFADKVCDTFEKLVSFNRESNSFAFIVPKCSVEMNEYTFLIKALIIDSPNSKVHIFKKMCSKFHVVWDFDLMNKINEFISTMSCKFNIFFNSKLPELMQLVGDYDFVDLVKQFEGMKQSDIVQNLLFHRVLFYVDEKQDILHPYIYKLLLKYKVPLYNEQLEPNKREEIVSFYQHHPEINGAAEISDLLASPSLGN